MNRLHQSILACVVVLTLLGTALTIGLTGARAQEATPSAASPTIPATPVGEQLTWVLAQFNGGAPSLTEAEIANRFDPRFLLTLPAPVLLDAFRETAATVAPVSFAGFLYEPISTGAIALVTAATGEQVAVTITIEAAPPHRITRLEVTEPPAPPSPTGRRVDIGGRALYLDCIGSGGPTVVLEGGISSDWAAVQSTIAARTRVCSYDRPDSPDSRSDPTAERVAQEVVDDLQTLLTASGEPGPYVLVGHSMGGLYVQLYAYEHPDEAAGLVLIDPTPEEFEAGLAALLTSLGTPVPAPTGEPTAQQISFAQMRQARAAGTLRPMPLVVLTHGRIATAEERPAGWPIAAEERLLRTLHEEIAHLVPDGRHIIVENGGHDIHHEQPALVSEEIQRVVAAVLDPSTWTPITPATPTTSR